MVDTAGSLRSPRMRRAEARTLNEAKPEMKYRAALAPLPVQPGASCPEARGIWPRRRAYPQSTSPRAREGSPLRSLLAQDRGLETRGFALPAQLNPNDSFGGFLLRCAPFGMTETVCPSSRHLDFSKPPTSPPRAALLAASLCSQLRSGQSPRATSGKSPTGSRKINRHLYPSLPVYLSTCLLS